jgi:hypothetical protein
MDHLFRLIWCEKWSGFCSVFNQDHIARRIVQLLSLRWHRAHSVCVTALRLLLAFPISFGIRLLLQSCFVNRHHLGIMSKDIFGAESTEEISHAQLGVPSILVHCAWDDIFRLKGIH